MAEHVTTNEDTPPPEEAASASSIAVDASSILLPQLAEDGITQGDVTIAIKVLTAVGKLNRRKGGGGNSKRNKKKRKKPNENDNTNGDKQEEEEDESEDHNDTTEQAEDDGLSLYQHSNLRPFRKALASCLALHQRTMFAGRSEEQHYEHRKLERSLKRQKMAERDFQKKHIANTRLRSGRVHKLNALKEDAKGEEELKLKLLLLVPDGHVETQAAANPQLLLLTDEANNNTTDLDPQVAEDDDNNNHGSGVKLPQLRSCYVCKIRYRDLHHFYDQLCPSCAALNWEKRHATANLKSKVAVVTGCRVKIGFQTCLKLLRSGCTVIATTRFPNAAVAAYRAQSDFEIWARHLQIYGLDLRDVTGLEAFTRFLKTQYGQQGIDILINNACQTIRRPRGFYVPMVENEQALWQSGDEVHKSLLQGCQQFENLRRQLHHQHAANDEGKKLTAGGESDNSHPDNNRNNSPLLLMGMEHTEEQQPLLSSLENHKEPSQVVTVKETNGQSSTPSFETSGVSHSAAMSQMIILPEDVGVSDAILPPGVTDINGHQLDLRTQNSWLLKLDQVSTPEIMECFFINAIAPFVLNSRLQPLMTIPQDSNERPDRFIINVSAMEGKFYRYKMANHPHTNMAKAALNMMTRTAAEELATRHRIYMNSVDTGWINDENPVEKASKIAATNLFQTPIDEIDAAARILDPVFTGINGGQEAPKDYGKFLKDYRETEW